MADETKIETAAESNPAQGNAPQPEHEFGVIIPVDVVAKEAKGEAKPVPIPTTLATPAALVATNGVNTTPVALTASVPAPPVPTSTVMPKENKLSQLLKSIQLPERRDFKGAADIPQQVPEARILEEKVTPAPQRLLPPQPPKGTAAPGSSIEPQATASSVVAMHTLKDDLQDVVREKKISLVRAVALEEEKKRGQERVAPEQDAILKQKRRRTTGILLMAVILFLLGGCALFGVFYIMNQRSTPAPTLTQNSILFAESTVTFSLDNQNATDLKNALAQARGKQLGTLGSITRIMPILSNADPNSTTKTQRPATLAEFFNAIGVKPPDEFMRAVGSDFFFGIHVADKNAPLFVIPVTSYDRAFAGMLAWEASMNTDLSPIFTAVPSLKASPSGLPVERTFLDVVLRNYDTRALEDDSGQIQLYYSFPNPNVLVIAESPYSFAEILSRLQAARKL